MKKLVSSEKRTVCSNHDSPFRYFAWPSVIRIDDDTLAMAMSGFRFKHICPFGKACISFSKDEGETWSRPAPVIDTPLDDRDSGLTMFADGRLIMTSFNNTTEFQASVNERKGSEHTPSSEAEKELIAAYLRYVRECCDENEYVGSTYCISEDKGITFGPVMKSPVTAPHGPMCMNDGSLMYIGRRFSDNDSFDTGDRPYIECLKLADNDRFEYVSSIENIYEDGMLLLSCEPHALQLPDGKIIVHIRVQGGPDGDRYFTVYQSESYDDGQTFTKPHALLRRRGGSPAHLIRHSSGVLISVYGYREEPYGIRAMISNDNGETWDTDWVLDDTGLSGDLGYPASVEIKDGRILTIYYENIGGESVISQKIWELPRI